MLLLLSVLFPVWQYYDIPERKNGTGYRYCDDFERAYAEFWSERKKDLK